MASTVWKVQLTFGLVTFAVRLVRAARKERIPLRYVRQAAETEPPIEKRSLATAAVPSDPFEGEMTATPVRQRYATSDDDDRSFSISELQRGFEVTPGNFAVI